MWETWVQSLGWEDPLEKGKATYSSILVQHVAISLWRLLLLGSTGSRVLRLQ